MRKPKMIALAISAGLALAGVLIEGSDQNPWNLILPYFFAVAVLEAWRVRLHTWLRFMQTTVVCGLAVYGAAWTLGPNHAASAWSALVYIGLVGAVFTSAVPPTEKQPEKTDNKPFNSALFFVLCALFLPYAAFAQDTPRFKPPIGYQAFKVREPVLKDKPIDWPRIEDDEFIMVAGSARPLTMRSGWRTSSWSNGWRLITVSTAGRPGRCSHKSGKTRWRTSSIRSIPLWRSFQRNICRNERILFVDCLPCFL